MARSKVLFAQSETPTDALERRVAGWMEAFDAQGNHRTATDGDKASADWLVREAGKFGVAASLEYFALDRVDPQAVYIVVNGRRIEGVPLFDAAFTGPEGITGRLGPLGSDAEIGLAESEPYTLSAPGLELSKQVAESRRSQHKAVVVLTRGIRPGLFLLNANSFAEPSGPPLLQVSSAESVWLKEMAAAGAAATLVAHVKRTPAQAANVIARIAGRKSALPPLVVMAPRSAWFQSVTEQGSRMACWLETLRVLAAGKPARDCLFVAFSGHELGALGVDAYLKTRPDLAKGAHAWIFFGSDIGSPHQPHVLHASSDALEQWAVAALKKEGLSAETTAPHGARARGESGRIQRGGGNFVTLAGDSDAYHNVNDRWPEAVDVRALARYARAFANGALLLANPPA
ncbi:MAG: M28 family peptidase [Rhodospirillaceae bacterium]